MFGYFNYAILKKGDEYLALFTNPHTESELGHYFDQGYSFLMYQNAFNAKTAIDLAKQNESSELAKATAEVNWLRQQNERLEQENHALRNRQPNVSFQQQQNLNPFEVLGVAESSSDEEIKEKCKKLRSALHPDHGGSNYLASLVNSAFDQTKSRA